MALSVQMQNDARRDGAMIANALELSANDIPTTSFQMTRLFLLGRKALLKR